jgi:hypothetical protein
MPMLMTGFLGTGALFAPSVDFPSDPMRKFVTGSMHLRPTAESNG